MIFLYILFYFICLLRIGEGIELTFELPDNARECFYEDMKSGIESVLEYQVVTGGQYDVDVIIEDPSGKELYKDTKKQYDNHAFTTTLEGAYKVCFSNEFSSFTHKVVYFDWQRSDKPDAVNNPSKHAGPLTAIENSAKNINDKLKSIDDFQTHHRLREATGRKRAEQLNERVMLWSLGQTCIIILIGFGQVTLLKSFFTDRRTNY
uniref:GOLD domain-containing protein n=1 Tax=Parastrongyloides trichosuri TaxID=131310 RepID=A0A0N4Z1P5_PARTI